LYACGGFGESVTTAMMAANLPGPTDQMCRSETRLPGSDSTAPRTACRIQPRQAEVLAAQQRDDRKHGRQGIGDDVQVGGAEVVVIAVVVVMTAITLVGVPVFMAVAAEDHGTDGVHGQADDGDDDRLVELDNDRVEEAVDALGGHQEREPRQQDGPGETRQRVPKLNRSSRA